jgi:hypothetical protein
MMKALSWLPFLSFALQTLAVPTDNQQVPLGIFRGQNTVGSFVEQINNAAQHLVQDTGKAVLGGKKPVETWFNGSGRMGWFVSIENIPVCTTSG